jgi:hypothetical protein
VKVTLARSNDLDMAFTSPYSTALVHRLSREAALRISQSPESRIQSSSLGEIPSEFFSCSSGENDATQTGADDVPSVRSCAVHLELLETFMVLRQKVVNSTALDDTLGTTRADGNDAAVRSRREAKWTKFMELAVARFEIWVAHLGEDESKEEDEIRSKLPPVDVLMVLHAFILDPRVDRECRSPHQGFKNPVLDFRFSWKTIVGLQKAERARARLLTIS